MDPVTFEFGLRKDSFLTLLYKKAKKNKMFLVAINGIRIDVIPIVIKIFVMLLLSL